MTPHDRDALIQTLIASAVTLQQSMVKTAQVIRQAVPQGDPDGHLPHFAAAMLALLPLITPVYQALKDSETLLTDPDPALDLPPPLFPLDEMEAANTATNQSLVDQINAMKKREDKE